MDRRKFLIGMGSLAAGSAAAVGTGAFSQATLSDRAVNVDIVGDNTAFATLIANDSGLDNGEYAEISEEGKLKLTFDEDADFDVGGIFGQQGTGLNTDAVYWFEGGVFGYGSRIDEGISGSIDWSGLDHPDRFVFWVEPQHGKPSSYPSEVDPNGDYTQSLPGTGAGSWVGVSMGIDTSGVDLQDGWETGTIELSFES